MTLFSASQIAFMAGSLIGDKVGGHNLLEPASLGKPLLSGPSYFNFQVIGEQLIEAGACKISDSPDDIARALAYWFDDDEARLKAGKRALEVVERNRGAVGQTLSAISPWLD